MTSSPGRTLAALLLCLIAFVAPAAAGESANERLRMAGGDFMTWWLARAPHEATRLGDHDQDRVLLPVTETTLAADLAWLRAFRSRLDSIPTAPLPPDRAVDRALLAARIDRLLLDLEVIRPFERDPGAYVPLVAGSVAAVLEPIASPCQRLRLAARRLTQVPEVLRAARINLRDPPRELTEIAIERYAGVLRFYRETVPALAAACKDAPAQADLAQADTTAVRAVEAFLLYLREDLLPASRGRLSIGPEACRRLLRTALLEDARTPSPPIDSLLVWARRTVAERRAVLDSLARAGGHHDARELLDARESTPPEARGLTPYVDRQLGNVRQFLVQRGIVTLPERQALEVRETLPFRRPLELAGLDAPGPWEARELPAWLEVTPPDSLWEEMRRQVHLARFDRWNVELTAIHEGLPGRYLRTVVLRGQPGRLRQALLSTWPGEDWGEYCEDMMVEEGYGVWNPAYRVVAAGRSLRHAGRSLAALALHAGVMSPAEAQAMLKDQCLLDADEAALETRRAAADPDVMGYTPGARLLLELRDEARRVLGPRFQIRVFNDAVLRYGASPAGIVRAGVRRELGVDDGTGSVGAKP